MKKYLCTVLLCSKDNVSDLEFDRSCRSMKEAQKLSDWISEQIATADPDRPLVLKFPCRRNQAPRTIVIKPDDISVVSITINNSNSTSEPISHTAIPMGFQPAKSNPVTEIAAKKE